MGVVCTRRAVSSKMLSLCSESSSTGAPMHAHLKPITHQPVVSSQLHKTPPKPAESFLVGPVVDASGKRERPPRSFRDSPKERNQDSIEAPPVVGANPEAVKTLVKSPQALLGKQIAFELSKGEERNPTV